MVNNRRKNMSEKVALLLMLMAGFVACENSSVKFNFLQTTTSIQPSETTDAAKDSNYFMKSFANLTKRKEDATLNLAAVDLLLDAVDEAIANEDSNVTIPEDIDPEQHPISLKDAVDRVSYFLADQSIEVEDLLKDINHLLDEINSTLLTQNWLQRKMITNIEVKVLWLKREVIDLYRNYTEAGNDISGLYNSLPSTDEDFDDDYDYSLVSQDEEDNPTLTEQTDDFKGSEDRSSSSTEGYVDETTTSSTMHEPLPTTRASFKTSKPNSDLWQYKQGRFDTDYDGNWDNGRSSFISSSNMPEHTEFNWPKDNNKIENSFKVVESYDSGDGEFSDWDDGKSNSNSASNMPENNNFNWPGDDNKIISYPEFVESYNSTTTSTSTLPSGEWDSFGDTWRNDGSEDDKDSNQHEKEKKNNWLESDNDETWPWMAPNSYLTSNWETVSSTTFPTLASLPPFNWNSLYNEDNYEDTDNDENNNVVHYNSDAISYSSYSDSAVYAGAIVGAIILKVTFWVMVIRCRYRYRNRLCYTRTLTVTTRNVGPTTLVPNLQGRVPVVNAGRVGSTNTNAPPAPPDDLPTYVEVVANDVPPPPKYEECQNETCEVDLATPNDLPTPPAYPSDKPKEQEEPTTTSDEAPLILEEV